MTAVDNYFPFQTGAGETATQSRWRLMGRLFVGSGVIPGYLNQFACTVSAGVATIQPGGAWIDGFYGETSGNKTMSISGTGTIVARMDPVNNIITLAYTTVALVQNLSGTYEIPLYTVTAGVVKDARQFIPALLGNQARARVHRNAAWTITNGAATPFDTVDWGKGFSGSTYTCPYSADYLVIGQWGCTSQSTNFWMEANIVHNGGSVATSPPNTAPTLIGLQAIIMDIVPCNTGDTLWLQTVCNANGYQGMIGAQRTFMSVRAMT